MSIVVPGLNIIAGAPNAGKSHLTKHLLWTECKKKTFDFGIVFTNTSFNQAYDFLPKKAIKSKYDPAIIKRVIEIQKANPNSNAFIIFDDCLGLTAFKTREFDSLMTEYRHLRLTIFICTQWINKIPPIIRSCASMVFMFRQEMKRGIVALYESYGQSFDNEKQWRSFMDKNLQQEHTVLVCNPREPNKAKKYKVFRAPANIPDFTLDF